MSTPSPAAGAPAVFDPFDPALIEDPYPVFARLREEAPVLHLPDYDVWAVTRYADVLRVVRDPVAFSSKVGMSPEFAARGGAATGVGYRIGAPKVRVLIATDPPEHQVFRHAVAAAFTPAAVRSLAAKVREFARQRAEALVRAGTGDFFALVAEPLPVLVLAELLGVPEEMHDEFRNWSRVITGDLDQVGRTEEHLGRGMGMFRYFSHQLRRRRGDGGTLFDSIARAGRSGVSSQEVLAFCAFLLVAGIETTTNLLTNAMAVLLRQPAVQQQLRERPDLVDSAVDEAIRYDTSVQALWRGTTVETELSGTRIPAGQRILVVFGAANRDGAKFPEPDRFLPGRGATDHVGFGAGPHFCLGAHLARLEIAEALRAVLGATRWIEPAGPGKRTRSVVLRGFLEQPVRVEPR